MKSGESQLHFFFFKIIIPILGPLHFYINFRSIILANTKTPGILLWLCWIYRSIWGRINVFACSINYWERSAETANYNCGFAYFPFSSIKVFALCVLKLYYWIHIQLGLFMYCRELICVPPKFICSSPNLQYLNVIIFGDRVFKKVSKWFY